VSFPFLFVSDCSGNNAPYNRRMPKNALPETSRLVHIVSRLRKECPWDRKQTHRSLLPYLLEEAHEVYEAIQTKRFSLMKEELGDLLLQIVLHSELANEKAEFNLESVSRAIADKMVRRHPHVFDKGSVSAQGHAQRWLDLKKKEKPERTLLEGVPKSLPSLQVAGRYGEIASSVGFDWKNDRQVWDKVEEEIGELQEELKKRKRNKKRIEEELGDLFFALSQMARHLGLDAEGAAKKGAKKFFSRFTSLEKSLNRQGREPLKCSPEELEAEWEKAKAERTKSARPRRK